MLRILLLCSLLLSMVTCGGKKHREGVALVVNGTEIPMTEVMQTAELLRESIASAYPEKALEGVNADLLAGAAQQLIAHRLLLEEARRKGITADSAEVDSLYGLLRNRAPDQAAFERELIRMGETDSSLRVQITDGVRMEKLIKQLFESGRQVDSQECREFYEKNRDKYTGPGRVRANQIFLPFGDSMPEAEKTALYTSAQKIREQIRTGTPFAECAKKHSKGPGAIDGGDIGWFKRGDLRKELEDPLFLLKKGETSDIISTGIGLFILQKTDEEAEKQLPYEDVAERVRFLLEIRERNRQMGDYIDKLKKTAKIEFVDTALSQASHVSPALLQGLPQ